MISVCIPLSNDLYFFKRKKIIFSSLKDLLYNLSLYRIKSQIVVVDFGGKISLIDFKKLFKKKNSYVSLKYIKAKHKFNSNFFYGEALKIAINNSDGKDILIKASDTFFNKKIYNFLKSKYDLKKNFYCALRKDFQFNTFINKKQFQTSKYKLIKNNDYLFKKIKLHTNAVGDLIFVNKKKLNKIKYFERDGYHNDSFIVGCLYFMGLKQTMIENGFIYKLMHNKTFENRNKDKNKNSFFNYIENDLLDKSKYKEIIAEILRAIFNYPTSHKESLGRIKLKIFLRYFGIKLYPVVRTDIIPIEITSKKKIN